MTPDNLKYSLMCAINQATIDNPAGAVELCVHLGLLKTYTPDRAVVENAKRELRLLVNQAITDGELIGSVGDGYYIIRTPQDMSVAIAHLKSQYQSIADRIKCLEVNYSNQYGKQVELNLINP